jgi:hypothetical protein
MNVIWYNQSFGNWDSGLLNSIFEKHSDKFTQHNTLLNPVFDKAIIIIVGKPNPLDVRTYLETIKQGLVILTSEEDAFFDWKLAIPERFEIWTQYYSPTTKKGIKERLLLGAPLRIRDYKINKHLPKKYLWSFVGQSQNPFRQQCVDVLKTLPNGFLHVAEMFGGEGSTGMEYQQYLDIMCQSEFVICPAGSMCVDSFRLYEAMECGAIPITDRRSPRDADDFNYWDQVIMNATGLPIDVSQWSQIKTLDRLITSGTENKWWVDYKQNLENKLLNVAQA